MASGLPLLIWAAAISIAVIESGCLGDGCHDECTIQPADNPFEADRETCVQVCDDLEVGGSPGSGGFGGGGGSPDVGGFNFGAAPSGGAGGDGGDGGAGGSPLGGGGAGGGGGDGGAGESGGAGGSSSTGTGVGGGA